MSDVVIPKGYQKTKVGVIPEEWEVVRLGDVGKVSMCKRILKNQTNINGEIPFYKIGTFGKKADAYISKKIYEEYRQKYSFPKVGDVLISASGTIGRTVIYDGKPSYFQDSNIVWIDNDEKFIKNNFLFYCYKIVKWNTEDTTISRLYNDNLRSIKIPLPPLKEQEKIAQILTTWDEAISKQKKLINAKERFKKGLMQKLLSGDVRFKKFNEEWEEVRLSDIGKIVTGNTPPTKEKKYFENGKYPWVTPTDITDEKNIIKTERYLTEEGIEKGRFIPAGSLLVTCIASIGKNAILMRDGSCNQQINAILPSKKNNINFLYYLIEYYSEFLLKYAGKSATPILNKKSFSKLKFIFPSLKEQQKISKVLSTADKEIELLKKELEALKKQKKELMQRLLTGKVRVKV